MISHRYRCIYIHIPKTAGTSIESALGHFDLWDEQNKIYNKRAITGRSIQDHRCLRMIERPIFQKGTFKSIENFKLVLRGLRYYQKNHKNINNTIKISSSQYFQYFKFSCVRNPWSRIFSAYNNVMSDKIHREFLGINSTISLHEFIEKFHSKELIVQQTYWLKNLNNQISLDYIMRFENLLPDFQYVCEKIGAKDIELPHKIKGSDRDYWDHYTSQSIDLVAKIYAEEIEFFGYEFA